MRAVRRRLRACAWLALLSISALAVGPTVSRLLLPAGSSFVPALDVAHAPASHVHGPATVASHAMMPSHRHHAGASASTAPVEAPNPPIHEHVLEHCGLCVLAAHAFTFVQDPPELVAVSVSAFRVLAPLVPSVPRLRLNWSPASSRGPPVLP